MKVTFTPKISKLVVYIPQRLAKKLTAIEEYPYTELVAPAGFGKTTALCEFIREKQADHRDTIFLMQTIQKDEETWFWEDFSLLFEQLDQDFSHSIRYSGIPEDQSGKRNFWQNMEKMQQRLSKKIILIIDFYSYIPDKKICDFLEYIIRRTGKNFHLVVATRQSIFSLQSFSRFYSRINIISVHDFVFSIQDIENYYSLFNVSMTSKELQNIHSLSEGWIILICENLRAFIENKQGVTEKYSEKVIDEIIYNSLPQGYKDFLSRVGFCKTFTLEMAEHIYSGKNVSEILVDLVRKNLYIKYNENTHEYCLDNCFSSYVRRKCSRLKPEEQNKQLKSIGDYFMKTKAWHKAREFYYCAKDFDGLMQAVQRRRFLTPYVEDDHLFISYYADCPPDIRVRYPRAILIFAKYLLNSNRRDLSEKVRDEFLAVIKGNNNFTEIEIRKYEAMYELFLTYEQYNNLENMLIHLNNTVELIANEPDEFLWPETGVHEIPSILYMYHRKAGKLENEVKLFTRYNSLYTRFTDHKTAGEELVMEAEAKYMTDKITEAEIIVYKARLVTNSTKQWGIWFAAVYLQIRIELGKGYWPKIEMLLEEVKANHVQEQEDSPFFLTAKDICYIYVDCKLEKTQILSSLFNDGWDMQFNNNFRALAPICVLHAEVLLARKEYIALIAMVDFYLSTARIYPNLMVEIMLEIEIASAYEKVGKRNNALSHLNNALAIAYPDWIIMPFVEFGRYISPLLPQVSKDLDANFVKHISNRCQDFQEKLNMIKLNYFPGELYHLTQQEVKISRLAAEGYSNKEIAEIMFIQECTVKTHLTHVFSKLNIEKRSQLRTLFRTRKVVDNNSDFP